MRAKLTGMYHSSSTEYGKIRKDRYHAKINNGQANISLVIMQWADQPVFMPKKDALYLAEIKHEEYFIEERQESYRYNKVIYLQEANGLDEMIYAFIFSRGYKETGKQKEDSNEDDKSSSEDRPF